MTVSGYLLSAAAPVIVFIPTLTSIPAGIRRFTSVLLLMLLPLHPRRLLFTLRSLSADFRSTLLGSRLAWCYPVSIVPATLRRL